jgi:hypothetical protein
MGVCQKLQLLTVSHSYGDNYASLGSVAANTPGQYLVRSKNASCTGYAGCITSPTTIGSLLVRVEIKNNTTDLADVDAYMKNCTLTTINPHTPSFPPLTLADFADLANSTTLSTLELTARLQSRAPPEAASFKAAVPEILALAGISNGSYNKPACVNLTLATALANASASAFINAPSSYTSLGNGWSILNNSYSGTFDDGTAIIPRDLIAVALYLQNTPENAIYPTLGSTQLSLTDSEAYLFTFSGKPPVAADGFWSLTMYDDDGYLVANKENTYAIGDRSNITYPSGKLVYGNSTEDGSFQVLVQNADVSPPSNWTAK